MSRSSYRLILGVCGALASVTLILISWPQDRPPSRRQAASIAPRAASEHPRLQPSVVSQAKTKDQLSIPAPQAVEVPVAQPAKPLATSDSPVLPVAAVVSTPPGQVPAPEPPANVPAALVQPADAPPAAPLALEPAPVPVPAGLVVHTDYRKAMQEAAEDRKMLFIYFYEPGQNAARKAFETITLADEEIQEKLQRYVVLKIPRDAKIELDGKSISLLGHAAFGEMLGRQGVAMVDLVHVRAEYYGHVVSTFPFTAGKYYRKAGLSVILDLPPGTLTQRTMIYAVRVHPEAPASTQGQFNTVLAEEAKLSAVHQASILVQGHHSWDARFHRINAKLPNGLMAQEVVAESWPNEDLVTACVDCVHSWRQSPGHWGAVRSRHPLFGYDIKRGRNGIWYATGIFGQR